MLVVGENVVEVGGCGFESVEAGFWGNFVFFGVRMPENASEKRFRGPVVDFAVGGKLEGVSVCELLVSGEFGGKNARFG
jgi:hypothetical protein